MTPVFLISVSGRADHEIKEVIIKLNLWTHCQFEIGFLKQKSLKLIPIINFL